MPRKCSIRPLLIPRRLFISRQKKISTDASRCLRAWRRSVTKNSRTTLPPFGKLKTALTEVRHTVHSLLNKKREKEPDPVEVLPVIEAVQAESATAEEATAPEAAVPLGGARAPVMTAEPADLRQAVASIAAGAAFLRKREPLSPAPYLILRGLRWGELRTVSRLSDSTLLEAPPTELRQKVKRLALANRWSDLLDACEDAMALPCSRAWLDLQRFSVAACSCPRGRVPADRHRHTVGTSRTPE